MFEAFEIWISSEHSISSASWAYNLICEENNTLNELFFGHNMPFYWAISIVRMFQSNIRQNFGRSHFRKSQLIFIDSIWINRRVNGFWQFSSAMKVLKENLKCSERWIRKISRQILFTDTCEVNKLRSWCLKIGNELILARCQ